MKDNKALEDPLADRMRFSEGANNSYKMELVHCSETDTGTYIARATNGFENATCTAQLIVEKRKGRNIHKIIVEASEKTFMPNNLMSILYEKSFLELSFSLLRNI